MRNTRAEEKSKKLSPYSTVAEVAERYRTGREQVHRWIRTGRLRPVVRVGRLVRISADALAEFEAQHTIGGVR